MEGSEIMMIPYFDFSWLFCDGIWNCVYENKRKPGNA